MIGTLRQPTGWSKGLAAIAVALLAATLASAGIRAVYLSAAAMLLVAAFLSSFRGRVDQPAGSSTASG
jgi:hypothetical protein